MRTRLGILLLAMALSASLLAAPPVAPMGARATQPAEKLIQLNFPKSLQLKTLVEYISQRMRMNILYDEALVRKTVTISSPAKISEDSLMGLFRSILKISGLVLVDADQPGWKRIVASKDLRLTARQLGVTPQRVMAAEPTEVVSQILEPDHVPVATITKAIQPLLSTPGGSVYPVPGREMMIVTDYAHNLRQAAQLIALIDRPGREAEIEFVPVKHRDAGKLATEVTALIAKKRTVLGEGKGAPAGLVLSAETRTNRIQMVYVEGADAEARELIALLDVPTDAETREYRFQHVSADRVDKLAQGLPLTERGRLLYKSVIDAEENLLLVTAPPDVHERIAELTQRMDVPPDTATQRYVCRHLAPQRLDKMMTDLLDHDTVPRPYKSTIDAEGAMLLVTAPPDVHARLAELQKQYDVKPDTKTHTYRFEYVAPQRVDKLVRSMTEHDEVVHPYKATAHDEGGMLIVTAPAVIHQRIEELAKELDVPEAEGEAAFVRCYKLVNTTASAVLATIRALDSGDGGLAAAAMDIESLGAAGASENYTGPNLPVLSPTRELPTPPSYTPSDRQPTTRPARPRGSKAGDSAISAETSDARVTIDQNTNSIIVVAPPVTQRIYKQLIALLDRRRPQVIVEVIMVTLDTSGNFSLGVELSKAGEAGDDGKRYLTFSSFGLSTADMDTGALTLKPGIGFNGVMVGADTWNVVVRALETSGKAKVLSAPKILVNDNATATLSSVAEAPFTSVNASNTVSTTSFAGYASAGTTVTLTPHISEGDHLQLKYSVTLNSFTGEGSGSVPPPRQTNTISSEVVVPSGQAVIVGGLTREDHQETESSLPGLGHIPILEYVVGNRSDNRTQSTLFVFLRPVILRDDKFEDLKFLSERDLKLAKMPPNFPQSRPMVMP